MKPSVLFVHQNFPAQFKHLAPALVERGYNVSALTLSKGKTDTWFGVRLFRYELKRGSTPGIHPWLVDFETKLIRGEACLRAALELKNKGYVPDVIIAHPGWGESLFLKDVWPDARLALFCEFYYNLQGADIGFDPEFSQSDIEGEAARLKMKNLTNDLQFSNVSAAISPTQWQASTFPEAFRNKITVIHDGIDTEAIRPNVNVKVELRRPGSDLPMSLTRKDEVITFVNRNLEPMRGYHVFMRALPRLLANHPNAKVIIVGGDGVSYGAKPTMGKNGAATWKEVFLKEVRGRISDADWERVHFVGQVPHQTFICLLQLSTVHVYLTYPFVLSWSLLEAMSAGAAIVASDTAPVREVISDGENGLLVDFFSVEDLVGGISRLLADSEYRNRLGEAARLTAIKRYDLKSVCLPAQIRWLNDVSVL